jgi:hypothetical protein
MIATIECATCSEIIGTIEKPEITMQDVLEYQRMVVCSNGHISATELIDTETEVPIGDQEE